MAEEKTRVDFNAPRSLVNRADQVAEVLDISRTRLLIDALQERLGDVAEDEEFRRRLKDAFYDGRVDFGTVEAILGTEEAMRLKLLRESLDREPPEPEFDGSLPADEAFYDGDVPAWSPDVSDSEERG
jgi:hypothetical protein